MSQLLTAYRTSYINWIFLYPLSPMGTFFPGNSLQNKLVLPKALCPGLISEELS